MRLNRKYLLLSAMFLGLLASCQPKPKDGRTDTFNTGSVYITADESFKPIIQEEIDVFESLTPSATINPIYTTEVEAVSLLLKDSVRLAIATRTFTPQELQSFQSRKFMPRAIKVAVDGLALIVNKQNPDTLISVKDIRRILTGETQRWKDIYPNSKLDDIYLVFDNQNSSTVRYAVDSICNGKPLDNKKVYALKTNPEVIDFVAKTPEAIGVVGVNWLTNHSDSTHLSFRDEVRVMSVSAEDEARVDNSYKPFQAYLYYDDYPLARPIYILLNDPRNGLSWGFSNFLQSDRGQRIILKDGLLPEVLRSYISVNVNEE